MEYYFEIPENKKNDFYNKEEQRKNFLNSLHFDNKYKPAGSGDSSSAYSGGGTSFSSGTPDYDQLIIKPTLDEK